MRTYHGDVWMVRHTVVFLSLLQMWRQYTCLRGVQARAQMLVHLLLPVLLREARAIPRGDPGNH